MNDPISKYLLQTQELFGDFLYFNPGMINNNFYQSGDIDSKIVFIKDFSSDIEKEKIFLNILKALNLSINQILVIDIINSKTKADKSLGSLLNKLNSKIIITLGLEVSQFLLDTNESKDVITIIQKWEKDDTLIDNFN